MLELRPICENCAKPLPPDSTEARICSFECTFCAECVENVLADVCPNCGGNFVPRPVRPARNWNGDNHLGRYPATEQERHRPVDTEAHRQLVAEVSRLEPARDAARNRRVAVEELLEAMDRGGFDLDIDAIDRLNSTPCDDSDPQRDR